MNKGKKFAFGLNVANVIVQSLVLLFGDPIFPASNVFFVSISMSFIGIIIASEMK